MARSASAALGGAGLEARSVAATTAVAPADDGLLGAAGALVGYLPEWVKALLALMSTVLAGLLLVVLISRRQLAQALRRAHFDVLTGLPNRAAIDEALRRRVAQAARNGSPLGVAMLDIDDFKAINDEYGHTKGDEVLTAVGAVARRTVRSGDLVGRFGGEELVLILPDTDQTGARTAAEKLRLALGEVTLPGLERRITASVGVAAAQGDRAALEGLIAAADAAMYRAKAMGRDRSEVASDLDRALVRL
jgi:diguanylate cyclase (GGDEF)-like protein